MDGNTITLLILLLLAVLLVPNDGRAGLLFIFLENIGDKDIRSIKKRTTKLSVEENKEILDMINGTISKSNTRDIGNNVLKKVLYIKKYDDPFARYIFHGGCHGCIRPSVETVLGCKECWYFDPKNRVDKRVKSIEAK